MQSLPARSVLLANPESLLCLSCCSLPFLSIVRRAASVYVVVGTSFGHESSSVPELHQSPIRQSDPLSKVLFHLLSILIGSPFQVKRHEKGNDITRCEDIEPATTPAAASEQSGRKNGIFCLFHHTTTTNKIFSCE